MDGWAEVEANPVHYNELVLTAASGSRRRDYDTELGVIEPGRVDAGRMVTHRFPLAETVAAVETSNGGGTKVTVMP